MLGSKQLLRTNTGLTGNFKLLVNSDYALYLESYNSNNALSDQRYKHFRVNETAYLTERLPSFFSGTAKDDIFSVRPHTSSEAVQSDFKQQFDDMYWSGAAPVEDRWHQEEYEYHAPLYVDPAALPQYFVVLRVDKPGEYALQAVADGVDPRKPGFAEEIAQKWKCVRLVDMSTRTKLGQFLDKNFTHNPYFPSAPLEVNLRKYQFSRWHGYDMVVGGFAAKSLFLQGTFAEETTHYETETMLTNGFRQNNVGMPHVLNLKFLFDDTPGAIDALGVTRKRKWSLNRYMGFYLKDLVGIRQVSPYSPPVLRDDASIENNAVLVNGIAGVDPTAVGWPGDASSIYTKIGDKFFVLKRAADGAGYAYTLQSDVLHNIAAGSIAGSQAVSLSYVVQDGVGVVRLMNSDNTALQVPNYAPNRLYLVEVAGSYHTLQRAQDGHFFVHTDTLMMTDGVSFNRALAGVVLDPVQYNAPTETRAPLTLTIYQAVMCPVADLDVERLDTGYSRYEYEEPIDARATDEPKLWAPDMRTEEEEIYKDAGYTIVPPATEAVSFTSPVSGGGFTTYFVQQDGDSSADGSGGMQTNFVQPDDPDDGGGGGGGGGGTPTGPVGVQATPTPATWPGASDGSIRIEVYTQYNGQHMAIGTNYRSDFHNANSSDIDPISGAYVWTFTDYPPGNYTISVHDEYGHFGSGTFTIGTRYATDPNAGGGSTGGGGTGGGTTGGGTPTTTPTDPDAVPGVFVAPASSEYSASEDLWALQTTGAMSSIWDKNQSVAKWGFVGSMSHADYPYKLNSSEYVGGLFNRAPSHVDNIPTRAQCNLDWFYTVGAPRVTDDAFDVNLPAHWTAEGQLSSFRSLEVDTTGPVDISVEGAATPFWNNQYFDLDAYTDPDTPYDYFEWFFTRTQQLQVESGYTAVQSRQKYAVFGASDGVNGPVALFRGLRAMLFWTSVSDPTTTASVKRIPALDVAGYKMSAVLTKRPTTDTSLHGKSGLTVYVNKRYGNVLVCAWVYTPYNSMTNFESLYRDELYKLPRLSYDLNLGTGKSAAIGPAELTLVNAMLAINDPSVSHGFTDPANFVVVDELAAFPLLSTAVATGSDGVTRVTLAVDGLPAYKQGDYVLVSGVDGTSRVKRVMYGDGYTLLQLETNPSVTVSPGASYVTKATDERSFVMQLDAPELLSLRLDAYRMTAVNATLKPRNTVKALAPNFQLVKDPRERLLQSPYNGQPLARRLILSNNTYTKRVGIYRHSGEYAPISNAIELHRPLELQQIETTYLTDTSSRVTAPANGASTYGASGYITVPAPAYGARIGDGVVLVGSRFSFYGEYHHCRIIGLVTQNGLARVVLNFIPVVGTFGAMGRIAVAYVHAQPAGTEFDPTLADFGRVNELLVSKAFRGQSPLQTMRADSKYRSVYPMIDEFGMTVTRRFIFKSTWDDEYYKEITPYNMNRFSPTLSADDFRNAADYKIED